VSASEIAARLGLKRARPTEWRGNCPVCGYVGACVLTQGRGGTPLLWCASCGDREAMGAVLRGEGYRAAAPADRVPAPSCGQREAWARALWEQAHPASGTIADRYLDSRGLPPVTGDALRFMPALRHREAARVGPAMLAAVRDEAGELRAVHRTWLREDGSGKADVDPTRKTLGSPHGCAARLMRAYDAVVLAEGIETALAASVLFGMPAWSCLTAGGLEAVQLPPAIHSVLIAADNDTRGTGQRAADMLAQRLLAEGRAVRVAIPDRVGCDFNDILMQRNARHG
jgi:phage/plasmid primase-like uncharacterized protein